MLRSEMRIFILLFALVPGLAAHEMASLSARRQLLAAVSQRQSRAARNSVEKALSTVVAEAKPFFFTPANADDGVWRLLWSTQTADVNPFALPSSVLGGVCAQLISSRDGSVQNIVRWGRDGKKNVELVGSARVRSEKFGRRVRRFVTITGLDVLHDGVRAVTLFAVRKIVDGQQNSDTGYLEDLYNDGSLRISQADNGLMYIYKRELVSVWTRGADTPEPRRALGTWAQSGL
ncbi:hypothetical protein T492DRAFT_981622 [Pavlovales sp. CCMP2436]|nr:hypothetical protein T492DRAFT_981622 [Pavlovales sp. CCMP2436]|mmetsp:Transcript_24588/g.58118  ORF Transcript_24588/g.58118 Transcript_24588/m.58118 type:complete len:233 (-) Transcript_24588:17-715(-)